MKDNERAALAKASHVHAGAKTQARARTREVELAEALTAAGVPAVHVDDVFDVVVGTVEEPKALVEVKTLLLQKNDKVTVHPRSLRKKLKQAGSLRVPSFLVAFDDREGKNKRRVFVRNRVGSFRLRNMERTTLDQLVSLFGSLA